MKKLVIILGNTSSGKSSLGKKIELEFGLPYISFGDIKREEIQKESILGKNLKYNIDKNLPINPDDDLKLINNHYDCSKPLASISGYPISEIEYSELSKGYNIIFGIYLEASEEILRKRFFGRVVCPICNFPGLIGDLCPIHNKEMLKRDDTNENEFNKRMKLFNQRIYPFIEEVQNKSLFQIYKYNSESLDLVSIFHGVKQYL